MRCEDRIKEYRKGEEVGVRYAKISKSREAEGVD